MCSVVWERTQESWDYIWYVPKSTQAGKKILKKNKMIDLSNLNDLDDRFVQPIQMLLHFELLLRYAKPCGLG